MATPINTSCLSAPNTTGNSPTSTAGPRIRREASRAWEMQASNRRTCLGNEVGEIGVWEKRVIGKIFMLPCAGFWVIFTVVFCLRYFRPSESIGLTDFFVLGWKNLDASPKGALGKEKKWHYRYRKILPSSQVGPKKNQPNSSRSRPWGRNRNERARKGLQLLAAQGGKDFLCYRVVLFVAFGYTASGGFFAIIICRTRSPRFLCFFCWCCADSYSEVEIPEDFGVFRSSLSASTGTPWFYTWKILEQKNDDWMA